MAVMVGMAGREIGSWMMNWKEIEYRRREQITLSNSARGQAGNLRGAGQLAIVKADDTLLASRVVPPTES
jgi:hypothetical protein